MLSAGLVCTVYSMTRTVIGGPSALRAGCSSARYMPSASTSIGVRVNEAEARHRMCAPVASTSRARAWDQEVPVAQHQHVRAQRRQQIAGQGLLPDGVRAERGPEQRSGPRLRRGQPADLRERPVPGGVGGAGEERGVLLGVGQVAGGSVDRDHSQPAAEHPRQPIAGRAADRTGHRVEQHVQRIGAQPGAGPRQVGDVRGARRRPARRSPPTGQMPAVEGASWRR